MCEVESSMPLMDGQWWLETVLVISGCCRNSRQEYLGHWDAAILDERCLFCDNNDQAFHTIMSSSIFMVSKMTNGNPKNSEDTANSNWNIHNDNNGNL